MPLNPKYLLFPEVFQSQSRPPHNRGNNPRVDTFGVGHKNLCTQQGVRRLIPLQRGGFSHRFCCCGYFSFTSFPCSRGSAWSDDELLLDSKDLHLSAGRFLGLVGLGGGGGGAGRGVWVSRQGGGVLCWEGATGARGGQHTTRQQDLLMSRGLPTQLTKASPARHSRRSTVR